MTFSVVTANLWRENPQIERDLATLVRNGAEVNALNEAWPWADEIEAAARAGYQTIATRARKPVRSNAMLVRGDVQVLDWRAEVLSRAVGRSPERSWTEADLRIGGFDVTVLNTHANAGVQAGPAKPRELPRVREYIAGSKRITTRAAALRAQGKRVIVLGDLNWAWSPRVVQWRHSPKAAFGRIGFVSQYDYDQLDRPKGDLRPIEYVLFHPADFAYKGQRFVTPEKSDHPWTECDLAIKPKP